MVELIYSENESEVDGGNDDLSDGSREERLSWYLNSIGGALATTAQEDAAQRHRLEGARHVSKCTIPTSQPQRSRDQSTGWDGTHKPFLFGYDNE